ncbi:MAG: DUF3109 family protein [Sphingobacteriales bacterium]|nr:MAG: DUF3109 family protein [Sphingobacteriales bacterium]
MIVHGNTLLSLDLFENEFVCNLSKCKGACCVEGDLGAPLLEEELAVIQENLEAIKPFMEPKARRAVEKNGFYETDPDGDLVTKCMSGRDCVFAINQDGVYKCAMENAFEAGKTNFKKPISCHLYPIRIAEVGNFEALNYSKWDICDDACSLGKQLQVPVYKFLQGPLVRKYGQDWYNELEFIATEFSKSK